jgi:hypothetical protein
MVSLQPVAVSNRAEDIAMRSAQHSNTRQERSHEPRRNRVCARAALRERRRPEWSRSLRRANQQIDSSVRLMYRSTAALELAEHCRPSRFIPAARGLLRLPRQLGTAQAMLDRAVLRLQVTLALIALEPDRAAGAPERLTRATTRWIQASAILVQLSERAEHTVVQLRETIDTASDADMDEMVAGKERPPIPEPYLNELLRSFLRRRRSRARERLRPLRRRRSAPLRTLDAPRRISRGRAPPLSSTCQL